jgi:hypothetical protein
MVIVIYYRFLRFSISDSEFADAGNQSQNLKRYEFYRSTNIIENFPSAIAKPLLAVVVFYSTLSSNSIISGYFTE